MFASYTVEARLGKVHVCKENGFTISKVDHTETIMSMDSFSVDHNETLGL